jgi:aryl-alcohol dehydrogenase
MPMLNYTGRRTDGSSALSNEAGPVSSNFFGQSSFAGHAITYERNVV